MKKFQLMEFEMTFGSYTFTQNDVTDVNYSKFWFENGKFDGIEFFIESIKIGTYLNLLIEDYNGGRSLFVEDAASGAPIYLEANWDFANASAPTPVGSGPNTSVPTPATLILLLTGLMGLISSKIHRRI